MPKLVIKENYDCVPILTIIKDNDDEARAPYSIIDVDDETEARFVAVINTYWRLQHELQLLCDLTEKETEVYELKKQVHLHKGGGENVD